jgi:hypothetical protein
MSTVSRSWHLSSQTGSFLSLFGWGLIEKMPYLTYLTVGGTVQTGFSYPTLELQSQQLNCSATSKVAKVPRKYNCAGDDEIDWPWPGG